MSIEIKGANKSPRYENGTWYWYFGNTFTLIWEIFLYEDGTRVDIGANDKVIFTFKQCLRTVYTFTCTNITENKCNLDFTKVISEKFLPGDYTFTIDYVKVLDTSEERVTTIGNNDTNLVCVEEK